MTPENFKKVLGDMNLLVDPHIIFCNPNQYQIIKDMLDSQPFIIESDLAVEDGKIIIVDRQKLINFLEEIKAERVIKFFGDILGG